MNAGMPAGEPTLDNETPVPDENEPASFPTDDDDTGLEGLGDGGTTRLLARLLRMSPCHELHIRYGGDHPRREAFCFTIDLLIRLIVVAILLAIIFAVAWKTLAPLPTL